MTSPTSKRQVFAKEYLADQNAKQAAIRAGYSERTAKQQGSRLLTYVDVQEEIALLEAAQQEAD
jgi:phage terminase small subunit